AAPATPVAAATQSVPTVGATSAPQTLGAPTPAVEAISRQSDTERGQANATMTPPTTTTTMTSDELARQTLARMTLEQKVGQVFMLGFEGTSLNASNTALIKGLHLGGVTLFARNIDNGPQLARLD